MHKMLTLLPLVFGLSWGALAADPPATQAKAASAPAAQRGKNATCNTEAGDKKGDERRAFMKDCLGAKRAGQQDKIKACNKESGSKKGEERKTFMSACLKR